MKSLYILLCGVLFCIALPCTGKEIFCGKIEKIFFPGPDYEAGGKLNEALLLRFKKMQSVEYELLEGKKKSSLVLQEIQLAPLEDKDIFFRLAGKKACMTGIPLEAHSAHHIRPVILIEPELVETDTAIHDSKHGPKLDELSGGKPRKNE